MAPMTVDYGPDPPRFGGWGALYHRFRPGYPAAVFDRLCAAAPEPRGLCVELGSGTGQATADLARVFARVIAVEPDADMARLIPAGPAIDVRVAAAETLFFPPGSVDAVVAATAFHWMDQAKVARAAAGWLRPRGVMAVFALGAPQYPDAGAAVQDVTARHTRRARAHMHDRIASWRPYAETLTEVGAFAHVEAFEIYAEHLWSPLEVAGFLMSTSFGQALARSTGDAEAALGGLATELDAAARGRRVRVRLPIEGAIGTTAPGR